jgi:ribonucleotide reductase, class II
VSTSRFPASAPAAAPVFYRTYSRMTPEGRESFDAVVERNLNGLAKLGKLSESEVELLRKHQLELTMLPSGRWLWVGGTPWMEKPENFSGAYNCTSLELVDLEAFGLLMDLAMMGCGTGAVLTADNCAQLPPVSAELQIEIVNLPGEEMDVNPEYRDHTIVVPCEQGYLISVGDSRKGWVQAYQELFRIACYESGRVLVSVDLGNVRPAGSLLKGFGGVANPIKLPELFSRVASILNKAVGRQLTPLECCKLIDEAALVVVAGNIRRTAGMRQFDSTDKEAATAKMNLWVQDAEGNWSIDPERDVLRMANHTRVFHTYPSYEEVEEAVRQQYHSGEGAIQFVPEAVARGNADLLSYPEIQGDFIELYTQDREAAAEMLFRLSPGMSDDELDHRMRRFGLNPCGEIVGSDFHCNLSEVHLNQLARATDDEVDEAFKAAALAVAVLLHHNFTSERMQRSREWDPIVGVSFTGLFDFFVHRFGVEWLEWWERGRPGYEFDAQEAAYLDRWRIVVEKTIEEYCELHGLRVPNRCTTVQPAGTKSLLTGASPGWHPPKAQRFIRRITFRRDDPVAKACMAAGYSIVPSQSDKDENGRLLDDPFDPRCTEWLVEIPTEVSWANLPGADEVDISKFSASAQFDFYIQVQTYYTRHNTSATIEFREHEIETLAQDIHDCLGYGYISAALLARFDASETFPRLPFEPISKEQYDKLVEEVQFRKSLEFEEAMAVFDDSEGLQGPAGCDSDKCLMPLAKPA